MGSSLFFGETIRNLGSGSDEAEFEDGVKVVRLGLFLVEVGWLVLAFLFSSMPFLILRHRRTLPTMEPNKGKHNVNGSNRTQYVPAPSSAPGFSRCYTARE